MRRVLVIVLLALVVVAPAAAAPRHRDPVVPCSRGLVALTFDDGPSATVTPPLVRLLQRERVPATFFMIGQHVDAHPEVVRMVDQAGFAIGNHTWAHQDLTDLSNAEIRATIRSTRRALVRAGVQPTSLARPPYGAADDRVRRVLERMGQTPVLWSIDPRDWAGASTAQIEARVLGAVRPHRTNVVLQHDGVTNSPATLRAISTEIRQLRRRGFCFADLDAAGAPTPPVPAARLSTDRRRVAEGDRVRVTVRLDRPTTRPTTVRLSTEDRLRDRVVRFGAGRTRAEVWLRMPQDPVDRHADVLAVHAAADRGTQTGGSLELRIVDDDPPPAVRLLGGDVTASPLLPTRVPVTVRLDRTSDRDVAVVVRSRLGRVSAVIAAGTRVGEVELTVPVGTPDQQVREIPVTVVRADHAEAAGASATLVVRPPTVDRATAARQALGAVTWPPMTLDWLGF
jgi:peptidoglycan/xylan/chitin deacetylase (PgdA/CDA1 family)